MDIMKVAMLIETISNHWHTRKYKDYVIHEAVSLGVISTWWQGITRTNKEV